MRVDVYHHFDFGSEFQKLRIILLRMEKLLMANQADLVQRLSAFGAQLDKVKGEIVAATAAMQAALEAAIANGGAVTPELEAAVEALAGKIQVLDDLNVDTPTP